MNFNKAVIVGNLTRDPETRALPSGQNVASFSIATNRIWNDQSGNRQEATEFHNVVAFGKLADICSRYLSKGRLVLIEGRIQTRSWEGQDGIKRYRTEIVADNMQMGPRPGTLDQTPSQPQEPSQSDSPPAGGEDIPVIEAEELPTPEGVGTPTDNAGAEPIQETAPEEKKVPMQDQDTDQSVGKNKEEVNVKNIPF